MKSSFSKQERILPKKTIKKLLSEGNRTSSKNLTAIWATQQIQKEAIRLIISIPKHTHKLAVNRNYIKRIIKEAYMATKNVILKSINKPINIILIYNKPTLPEFNKLKDELLILFQKINNNLYEKS
tara:strand:+ start:1151 stop:1528 length:378 start_codon:yes stop_codon:yes gene_type:complete